MKETKLDPWVTCPKCGGGIACPCKNCRGNEHGHPHMIMHDDGEREECPHCHWAAHADWWDENIDMKIMDQRSKHTPPTRKEILDYVSLYADEHAHRWLDKDDSYWLARLTQEVGELAGVIVGDHDDSKEHELLQIASICLNFLHKLAHQNNPPPQKTVAPLDLMATTEVEAIEEAWFENEADLYKYRIDTVQKHIDALEKKKGALMEIRDNLPKQ